jgi:hypothetical protein
VERPSPDATFFKNIGLIGINSSNDAAIQKGDRYERRWTKKGINPQRSRRTA